MSSLDMFNSSIGKAVDPGCIRFSSGRSSGDDSGGVPPLPIPNREVKPTSADGTALSGRVGHRRLFKNPDRVRPGRDFFCELTNCSQLFYCYIVKWLKKKAKASPQP